MSRIIAGHFQLQEEAQRAVLELRNAGFPQEGITYFFLNPAGQHHEYPIGGDQDKSPGAKETDKGAAAGIATGAAIGIAATPLLGPVGPITGALVGAHMGGLVGGMSSMKERGEEGSEGDTANTVLRRRSGMMVAVALPDDGMEDSAVQVLRRLGAADIEMAEGTIANGDWSDFDPLTPIRPVNLGGEPKPA